MHCWDDGLEEAPDGSEMRQVPTRFTWSTSLWVSEDGMLLRRHFDVTTGSWRWDGNGPLSYTEDFEGRQGFRVDNQFRPIEQLIALAWLWDRLPGSRAQVEVVSGKPLNAKYMRWVERETIEELGIDHDEVWKPLKSYKCGIVTIPDGYQISTKGRLKGPCGITKGFYFVGACGETRMASVAECGLVDLWVAAKLIPPSVYLPPALHQAANAMMSGLTPKEHAEERAGKRNGIAITEETSWSYYRQALAALRLPRREIRELADSLSTSDLWRFLTELVDQGDDRIDGPLKSLFELVEEELPEKSRFWRGDCQMSVLGFARQCAKALA